MTWRKVIGWILAPILALGAAWALFLAWQCYRVATTLSEIQVGLPMEAVRRIAGEPVVYDDNRRGAVGRDARVVWEYCVSGRVPLSSVVVVVEFRGGVVEEVHRGRVSRG